MNPAAVVQIVRSAEPSLVTGHHFAAQAADVEVLDDGALGQAGPSQALREPGGTALRHFVLDHEAQALLEGELGAGGAGELSPVADAPRLSHVSPEGEARMVDVSEKEPTVREARARAFVRMIAEMGSEGRGRTVELRRTMKHLCPPLFEVYMDRVVRRIGG